MCWAGNGADFPDLVRVEIGKGGGPERYSTDMLFEKVGVIGGGGNSGFQALNLAAQFGADRILLIGFDMTDRSGVHWYGRNKWPMANNPDQSNFTRWLGAMDRAAPELARRGVRVINANPASAITAFPRMSLRQAVDEVS
jgi:hypothetical protein